MKKKTAVLTAGFLSLGVLVLASNMIVDGREGAKGKTIPYTRKSRFRKMRQMAA